jgi:iron complex transport system ATP-binding protein
MNAAPANVFSAGLAAHSLGVRAGTRELVRDLSLDFAAGEFVAILGRNGSGKTLTLHTLAGLRAPHAGSVTLDGASLTGQGRRAIARRLGLLMQDVEDSFATTAMESVLIGRHPHLALWQWEGAEDERLALAALTRLDLGDAGERSTATLSGGEQRRVAIASLLAQQPQIFLLDEPTNHLDPHHQLAVLGLFRELANEGKSVIATLHDPTLAARFADRVILLFGDGRWRAGPARELLTGQTLSELYLTQITEVAAGDRRIFVSA